MHTFQSRAAGIFSLGALAALSLTAQPASAGTSPFKLYNTGVSSNGTVAALGTADLHYKQILSAGGTAPAYLFDPGYYSTPTASEYISPSAQGGQGFYTADYQTTFDLTGLNPGSAVITGEWSTDNVGNDILINGKSTGLTCSGFSSFTAFDLTPFQADFVPGINTLDFVWTNNGDTGALDVQSLQGAAAPVPEASTTVSLGLLLTLGGLCIVSRKKKSIAAAGLS